MTNVLSLPLFSRNQQVYFVGGAGLVSSCQLSSEGWLYTIEMELNPECQIGRLGSETAIVLSEADIQGVIDEPVYQTWAA
jgi:hypothetical protein